MTEGLDWVTEEMAGLTLGDARFVKRPQRLLSALFTQASQSIPAACQGAAEIKGAYRWLEHDTVTPGQVLALYLIIAWRSDLPVTGPSPDLMPAVGKWHLWVIPSSVVGRGAGGGIGVKSG